MDIPHFTLNDGTKMPSVGLGCWMGTPGGAERVYDMCMAALKCGYRHLDTAALYGNEEYVGRAIRDSGIPRTDIYLTTKLWNTEHHRVKEAFEDSLQKLGVDYIDLYLLHWPQGKNTLSIAAAGKVLAPEEHPTFIETYKEMEKLLQTGKVKTIGVSNFSIKTLEVLLPQCSVIPATNQVELHPCLPQNDLKAYCEARNILLTAYSPLGQSTFFMEEPTIKALAEKLNSTPAQIVLSWAVQRGTAPIPKSEDKGRMLANISLLSLSAEDMAAVDGLHQTPGNHKTLIGLDKNLDGTVFGWTYERLGWNMGIGGSVLA
ncbi:NADP-dependent oxidoreductase domain-containing protein [Mycena belliarum]|uniref:NADP-dependent oxidoreductase domain-containing protein n=1 Tax=Mycena belliarum TaxID=1033014 RepID=A0AAD6XNI0_9AGAR|nr:NADP-dependent oxidoreductase domain-containing protein [Mycena belliae]